MPPKRTSPDRWISIDLPPLVSAELFRGAQRPPVYLSEPGVSGIEFAPASTTLQGDSV
jgi:hypothetical protein